MIFAIYIALGAFAGLLAGLFGIGGGLIIVPVLVLMFEAQDMHASVLTHMAVGTSLATIIVTSLSSVRQHHLKGAVDWSLFPVTATGLCLGAGLGAITADLLSGPLLQQLIGGFAILMACKLAFGGEPHPSRALPGKAGLFGVGGFIGWVSAIFGIGGGSLSVPFFIRCNMVMQRAVGTSAALGLPIALSGAASHMLAGLGHDELPEFSSGYIYWPAFLGISLASTFFARYGARLAHRLEPLLLKRIFAGLLVLVGLRFLLANL